MTKTRKQSLTPLMKKADNLLQYKFCSLNHFCIVCGKSPAVGHHYVYKSQSSHLRWDINNLVPLCATCHSRHHLSGDSRILKTILFKKGKAWADKLDSQRPIKVKLNKGYLKSVIEKLSE